ncbi:hypothetical protein GCM10020000_29720 [Streptomyces olivoverticillatus]
MRHGPGRGRGDRRPRPVRRCSRPCAGRPRHRRHHTPRQDRRLRLRPQAPPRRQARPPGRVLDIKSVVETDGGNERREDTNVDVTFALQAEVLFDKDSAHLGGAATDRIRVIAEEARKQHAAKLRIFGFTDNLGSADHGVALSKDRANAVQRQLAQDLGSSAVAYEIRGYGEDYPIADNATEDGRRKNRRVEVSFPRGKG